MAVPSQEVWWQFWAIFLDAVQNLKATQCAHWVCLVCYFWSFYGTFGLSSAKNHRFGPCAHAPHSRLVFVHELVDNSLPPATCACEQSAPALAPPTKPPAGLNTPAGCCRQCGCTPEPPPGGTCGAMPRGARPAWADPAGPARLRGPQCTHQTRPRPPGALVGPLGPARTPPPKRPRTAVLTPQPAGGSEFKYRPRPNG